MPNAARPFHNRLRLPWFLQRATRCEHLSLVRPVQPSASSCEDCLAIGDTWVHLRMCLTCGHVGCCDASKNTHAAKHFRATGHPVIRSYEPGEAWRWCYIDERKV